MEYSVSHQSDHCRGIFQAMASPCEILAETTNLELTQQLTSAAHRETKRIEDKFSRYDSNSLCSRINSASLNKNTSVQIDEETFQLLEFANSCFQISHGLFDITSGVLRKVWSFDGGSTLPAEEDIQPLLKNIGWESVIYDKHQIMLPQGMEIDFGGIAKEYAVDKVAALLKAFLRNNSIDISLLINFGGDLVSTSPKVDGSAWTVGIENPSQKQHSQQNISLIQGALATSGDARRFQLKDGIRYGHILNPKTGWPIENAPASVTVAAPLCITAGMLSTMALLQGNDAENFLKQQQLDYWILN